MATRKRSLGSPANSPRARTSPRRDGPTSDIYLSRDDGVTWTMHEVPKRHILVIADGAGVRANEAVYADLTAQGYELDIVETGSADLSFQYPPGWQRGNPASRTSRGSPTYDLAGFAHKVGRSIGRRPPSLIICGSRGSQVTIGVVMRHYWRGPFVAMNGGPMTSNTSIPREAFPCFMTFGRDYFPTKDVEFTDEQFQVHGNQRGLLMHLPEEAHMPRGKSLRYVLGRYIELAQKRAKANDVQEILWPVQPMLILQLVKGRAPEELWEY